MLPNPKNNKNINNLLLSSSEPVVDETQVNLKKLQVKRKIIIFSLILTAGLSFIFWSYKSIKTFVSSPPKFNFNINLAKFSFPTNSKTITPNSAELLKFLKKSPANWSVYASLDTDYSKPVFEYQSTLLTTDNNFNPFLDKISAVKASSQSWVNSSLPQGLFFQEIIESTPVIYYQGLIHLPKNKILILIKNNNLINSSQIQTEISSLINEIYWHAVNFLD